MDPILLGETIPAISMFYVYMVPTPTDVCYKYKKAERLLVLRDIEERLYEHGEPHIAGPRQV